HTMHTDSCSAFKAKDMPTSIRSWRGNVNAVEWQSSLRSEILRREALHASRAVERVLRRLKSAWPRSVQSGGDAAVGGTPAAVLADGAADRSHRCKRHARRRGVASPQRRVNSTNLIAAIPCIALRTRCAARHRGIECAPGSIV